MMQNAHRKSPLKSVRIAGGVLRNSTPWARLKLTALPTYMYNANMMVEFIRNKCCYLQEGDYVSVWWPELLVIS